VSRRWSIPQRGKRSIALPENVIGPLPSILRLPQPFGRARVHAVIVRIDAAVQFGPYGDALPDRRS
jgi:hypothetical protein